MNNYEEKRQKKLDYYRQKAVQVKKESEETYNNAQKMSSVIPMGQPILIGHHSEGRDRRYRDRIHNKFKKSFELHEKSEYYEDKVKGMENNNSIFSDDPEAIKKLKEKLGRLEIKREKIKESNKLRRKEKKPSEFPHYTLPYLSQEIRNIKNRIESLEKIRGQETQKIVYGDVTFIKNIELNRLQIFFNDIPEKELRKKLKSNGFRWSPTNQAWQRHLNQSVDYYIKRIKEILPTPKQKDEMEFFNSLEKEDLISIEEGVFILNEAFSQLKEHHKDKSEDELKDWLKTRLIEYKEGSLRKWERHQILHTDYMLNIGANPTNQTLYFCYDKNKNLILARPEDYQEDYFLEEE